ncbi:MAG: glycosyltransferase family 4 protein [Candidatus Omnitrophica bacterium]|nr:glycosyltransferase family 4 protein [Candidatus Omnitrophota bacterium]
MKIGIDMQSATLQATGIGYYARCLSQEYEKIDSIDFRYYRDSQGKDYNTLQRLYWENVSLSRKARNDKIDILHVPGFAGPYMKGAYRKITTVHDLIGLIYPQNLALVSRLYWQRWLPAAIRNSDFIIADSENTKRDIIRLLKIPVERIKVVYLAADEVFRPIEGADEKRARLKAYGIDKDYILNVGTVEPRKNVPRLMEAFAAYLKESKRDDLLLVIAGKKAWGYDACLSKMKELKLEDKVTFCDYVDNEDLPLLYNLAEAFAYPSFYEGFGLPVLEAMACGVPVICSKASSLPEIGGDAGIYVDPEDTASVKAALSSVLGDKGFREQLRGKSIEQANRFSWAKTAAETIAIYKEVLN